MLTNFLFAPLPESPGVLCLVIPSPLTASPRPFSLHQWRSSLSDPLFDRTPGCYVGLAVHLRQVDSSRKLLQRRTLLLTHPLNPLSSWTLHELTTSKPSSFFGHLCSNPLVCNLMVCLFNQWFLFSLGASRIAKKYLLRLSVMKADFLIHWSRVHWLSLPQWGCFSNSSDLILIHVFSKVRTSSPLWWGSRDGVGLQISGGS